MHELKYPVTEFSSLRLEARSKPGALAVGCVNICADSPFLLLPGVLLESTRGLGIPGDVNLDIALERDHRQSGFGRRFVHGISGYGLTSADKTVKHPSTSRSSETAYRLERFGTHRQQPQSPDILNRQFRPQSRARHPRLGSGQTPPAKRVA